MANPAQKSTRPYKVQFVTDDRFLVAALISNGVAPDLVSKTKEGMCQYSFDRKQKVIRLLKRYDRKMLTVRMDYFDRVLEMGHDPYDWQ